MNKNLPWNKVLLKAENDTIGLSQQLLYLCEIPLSKVKSVNCKEFGRANLGVLAFRARLERKGSEDGI